MAKNVNEIMSAVAVAEGVKKENVKNIFLWYDLLSCALAFQILYLLSYKFHINFGTTMLCVICVWTMDVSIKNALEKDTKNYKRLKKQMPLIKLWTIPLVLLAVTVVVCVGGVNLGLI